MIKSAFDCLRNNGFIARPGWVPKGDVTELLLDRADELRSAGHHVKGAVFFTKEDVTNRTSGGAYPIHFGSVPTRSGKHRGLPNEKVGEVIVKQLRDHGVWCEWSGEPTEPIIVKEN